MLDLDTRSRETQPGGAAPGGHSRQIFVWDLGGQRNISSSISSSSMTVRSLWFCSMPRAGAVGTRVCQSLESAAGESREHVDSQVSDWI